MAKQKAGTVPGGEEAVPGPCLLSASEVAKQSAVAAGTLRYYVMLGLVSSQRAAGSRRRMFPPEAVEQVRLVRKLNASGYSLREIREIFAQRWLGRPGGSEPA